MAIKFIDDTILTAIANAIRTKLSSSDTYKPSEMATAIGSISGGITPTGTKPISITQNGTTTEDVTSYASASITANVPNTYAAGDEGKVVSNGALVSQTSDTVTTNDTYDTTLINSLTVAVSSGGSSGLTLINTLTVTAARAVQIDYDPTWFDTYDYVLIDPHLTLSSSDYVYVAGDNTSSGYYTTSISKYEKPYFIMVTKMSSNAKAVAVLQVGGNFTFSNYIYIYTYTASKKMTGTIDIYGVNT